jgi:hypothetical protein
MNEGRYDERLKGRVEESTCPTYTGLHDKNFVASTEVRMCERSVNLRL